MVLSFAKNNVCDYLRPLAEPLKTQKYPEHGLLQQFSMKEVSSESPYETTHLSSLTHWGHRGLIQFFE